MEITVRQYTENDVKSMIDIWNEVVEEGIAFPQKEGLDEKSGSEFFAAQTYCGVAEDSETGEIIWFLSHRFISMIYASTNVFEDSISEKSSSPTAWNRHDRQASGSCNSMPWSRRISARGTSMKSWDLCRWA